MWIELKVVARISNGYVLDSSVLHATISRVRDIHPPMGVICVPAPTYMGSENYVKTLGGVLPDLYVESGHKLHKKPYPFDCTHQSYILLDQSVHHLQRIGK